MSKIVWFTGQPGSGKTTLANQLIKTINLPGQFIHIDGDDLRSLTDNKDYSEKGRRRNIRLAQQIAIFCSNKGFNVVVSLVAPFKDMRDNFKNAHNVIEFYLYTSEKRGREHFFSDDYKKPSENYIELDTGKYSIDECTEKIIMEFHKQ
ncbi:MAG: adenylyl-sulfate kinase [Gammaproteobacteria bacterium]|nr:adenylyl-sulfate kinase [Gammaproteobacteria bacterium]